MSESRKHRGTRRQAGAADASKIFTEGEKKALLVGHVFQGAELDGVDRRREARATRVADPAHILVFCEDPGIEESLRAHLASEGFKVTGAKTPLEAAWCLADGHVDLFLIHFPDAEWVVSAILMEVRRAHPTMPIVGLAPTMSNELSQLLARIRISKVLPASTSWQGLAQTIHEALGSLESATGGQT